MKKIMRLGYLFLIFILLASYNIIGFNPENRGNFLEEEDGTLSRLKTNQGSSTFVVGVISEPYAIDPIDCWDTGGFNVIHQVCEGLFQYNLSDHNLLRINHLAESYWWETDTILHIKLREGILFHDMQPFNSSAALWNFNRILYLTNCTGTLPGTQSIALTNSLYYFPDGITPIINTVTAVGLYNITITLNNVYSPLLDLLCFTGSYMVSPFSTPADDYIDLFTDDVVGTGPFVYEGYTPDIAVNFTAFDNYWQGMANITEMMFSIITDPTARNNAMLNHDIDYLQGIIPSMIPTFEGDTFITVMKFTETYGIPGLPYYYLGMNNERVNVTWRKAISYAINYTYIIEDLQSNLVVRANSPISPGFGNPYNASVTAADYDLTLARQTLVDAGLAPGLPVNSDPLDPNWLAANLLSLNYSYNIGNAFRYGLYNALVAWLDAIGITVNADGLTWSDFINKLYSFHDQLELFWIGWGPDYLDPFNMLYTLFNPTSNWNSAQVNDAKLNTMMATALATTDDTNKNNIYKNIQWYLAERLYPHCFGYHGKITYVYSANLTNYPHNALNILYFYPCEWAREGVSPPPTTTAKIFIDDSDPNYNWSKTALENDWCTGLGTWNDPYVIQDVEIDGELAYNGIEIYNSSVYFKIENCTIYNCSEYGIRLVNANNSILFDNNVHDMMYGIFLTESNNHTIYQNHLWDILSYGICLFTYCDHCELEDNLIEDSMGAIVGIYGFDILIFNNTLISNYMGIGVGASYNVTVKQNDVIDTSYHGIVLQDANETLIKGNYLYNNSEFGIYFMAFQYGCNDNTITYNQIINTVNIGIGLDNYSSQNTIFLNYFVGNTLNAQDNGTSNAWDNGAIGNFWDDYSGVDADDDGIGDTPYLIDGEAGSMDNYPIFDDGPDVDITPPVIIINEPDMGDEFTTTAPIYEIEITEPNLDSMWYTVDGGTTNNTITSLVGTIDQIVWNVLPYGVVTITFYANDTNGNVGSATVLVYKNAPITPPGIPGINPILLITMISIGIIGLIWQFKQKKPK